MATSSLHVNPLDCSFPILFKWSLPNTEEAVTAEVPTGEVAVGTAKCPAVDPPMVAVVIAVVLHTAEPALRTEVMEAKFMASPVITVGQGMTFNLKHSNR